MGFLSIPGQNSKYIKKKKKKYPYHISRQFEIDSIRVGNF
jgi:hypothetical protein